MIKLKIHRFTQDPSHCACAASACVVNFYDKNKDYEFTKALAKKTVNKDLTSGLESGEICLLLNNLGFKKVTLVTSNLNCFDFSWAKMNRKQMLKKIADVKPFVDGEYKSYIKNIIKWLGNFEYDNKMIIDYDFGKYIRAHLDAGNPVAISFNWTQFFKYQKYDDKGQPDDLQGCHEEHAVVLYGYNQKGVFVCDSHDKFYKYRLKKYRQGLYTISWEHLMTVMGYGDVFLADNYGV